MELGALSLHRECGTTTSLSGHLKLDICKRSGAVYADNKTDNGTHQTIHREKLQTKVSHLTVLNEKKLLLENLAKVLLRFTSWNPQQLFHYTSALYGLSSSSYMLLRSSSILEDFNWAATLVLRVHILWVWLLMVNNLR